MFYNVSQMEMATKGKSKEAERSFPFLRVNEREGKPRKRGLTEIRGAYYSVIGRVVTYKAE